MNQRFSFVGVLVLVSCAAPKYAYDFGQSQTFASQPVSKALPVKESDPVVESEFTAEVLSKPIATPPVVSPTRLLHRQKSEVLAIKPVTQPARGVGPLPPESVKITGDLKRSVIFVVVGGLLLLVGSDTFVVLGSLSLLIGVIFGIKWLLRDRK